MQDRVKVVLMGGSFVSVSQHPDDDEEIARELQDAASRLEYQARQLQAQAAMKRAQVSIGMAPDAWHGPRSTSPVRK